MWTRAFSLALLVHAALALVLLQIHVDVKQPPIRVLLAPAVVALREVEVRAVSDPAPTTPPRPKGRSMSARRKRPSRARRAPAPRMPPPAPAVKPEAPPPADPTLDPLARARATVVPPVKPTRPPLPGVVAPSAPPVQTATTVTLDLHPVSPAPSGTEPLVFHQRPPFTTHIEPDGTIRFEDKRFPFQLGLEPTTDPYANDPTADLRVPELADDDAAIFTLTLRFDPMTVLMRALGDDPYRTEKSRIAQTTEPMRRKLADEACTERLRAALAETSVRLERLWGDPKRTTAAKRKVIFQLWEECAESGPEERVATGKQVRATIEAFVQESLPEGSPDAFTRDELALLNRARACQARFAPYARTR